MVQPLLPKLKKAREEEKQDDVNSAPAACGFARESVAEREAASG
jgi:hypothetical protein